MLTRNPNYHGSRPHHFARIELAVGISARRAVAAIEAGAADYTIWPSDRRLARAARAAAEPRDSPPLRARQPAAARGRQQYFVNPGLQLDYFVLNTHRPLFSDVRLRQAVNYAIDRRALARARRWIPAGARASDRPLPAAGNARLPRRTRLPD